MFTPSSKGRAYGADRRLIRVPIGRFPPLIVPRLPVPLATLLPVPRPCQGLFVGA